MGAQAKVLPRGALSDLGIARVGFGNDDHPNVANGGEQNLTCSSKEREVSVFCPNCRHSDTRVVDTRILDEGTAIRRRRECSECGYRFTTMEMPSLSVRKRSGTVEPFSRGKIADGVRKASYGRPIDDDQIALLAQQVEESLRASGKSTVSTQAVGEAVLPFLKDLDQVTYMRFASVYSNFETIDDFETLIKELREAQSA